MSFIKTIQNFYNKLVFDQEPLGEEFEKVLYNNIWELYESETKGDLYEVSNVIITDSLITFITNSNENFICSNINYGLIKGNCLEDYNKLLLLYVGDPTQRYLIAEFTHDTYYSHTSFSENPAYKE